jgi:hypothetical protein
LPLLLTALLSEPWNDLLMHMLEVLYIVYFPLSITLFLFWPFHRIEVNCSVLGLLLKMRLASWLLVLGSCKRHSPFWVI